MEAKDPAWYNVEIMKYVVNDLGVLVPSVRFTNSRHTSGPVSNDDLDRSG